MALAKRGQYPFAARDGEAIPTEITQPIGTVVITFADSASVIVSALEASPPTVLRLTATAACWILFEVPAGTGLAAAPTAGNTLHADLIYLAANEVRFVVPPDGKNRISAWQFSSGGSLIIEPVTRWQSLSTQYGAQGG